MAWTEFTPADSAIVNAFIADQWTMATWYKNTLTVEYLNRLYNIRRALNGRLFRYEDDDCAINLMTINNPADTIQIQITGVGKYKDINAAALILATQAKAVALDTGATKIVAYYTESDIPAGTAFFTAFDASLLDTNGFHGTVVTEEDGNITVQTNI